MRAVDPTGEVLDVSFAAAVPQDSPRTRIELGNAPIAPHRPIMPRILIATIVGLIGFLAYVIAVVTLAGDLPQMHWAVQALFFLVAGTVWVVPVRSLMLWAARK